MLFNKSLVATLLAFTSIASAVPVPINSRGLGFLDIAESVKDKAKTFVDSIPKDKLLGAGDAGNKQGTIFSADGKGNNANGGRPNDGFRVDQQKPPSAGSGFQANIQAQVNGKTGVSTIGGVRVPTGASPSPNTLVAKLKHSINTGKFQDVAAPKTKTPVKFGKKFRRSDAEREQDIEALLRHILSARGLGFLDIAESVKDKAKTFVDSIPKDKLLGAGDSGNKQGTIFSADGKGNNANGGRPTDGFRVDQQKPPSAGSGFQANIQAQVNGKTGVSTIGGVRVPTGASPSPNTLVAKLKHSINTGKFQDVAAPKTKTPVKFGKKF